MTQVYPSIYILGAGVRIRLLQCAYFTLFAFSASFLRVPSFLSLLMSLPFGCLKDPEGMPSFFSRLPIRMSLRICLAIIISPFCSVKDGGQCIQNGITCNGKQSAPSSNKRPDCDGCSLGCASDRSDCATKRNAETCTDRYCAENRHKHNNILHS